MNVIQYLIQNVSVFVSPIADIIPANKFLAHQSPEERIILNWHQADRMRKIFKQLPFGVQFLEGNILTPMVQSEAADLPPALLLPRDSGENVFGNPPDRT